VQVSPSVGLSGGETAFHAEASGWTSNADPNKQETLQVQYGVCKVYNDCEGAGVVWMSELMDHRDSFHFAAIPPGDPANGNLTTVRMCAVNLLGGEVTMSQTCTQLHVEVARPERYQLFTGAALTSALKTPALRLQAASIAAEQIASAQLVLVSQAAVVSSVLDMLSAGVVTEATLSSCLSIIRQLIASSSTPSSSSPSSALGGTMIVALTSGAARLLDASAGDFDATVALANDLLVTFAQVLALDNLDGIDDGMPNGAAALVNAALSFTATALLEGVAASNGIQSFGSEELSIHLFKGDTRKLVLRKLELFRNSAPPNTSGISGSDPSIDFGGRRRRQLLQSAVNGPSFRSVATRRGSSEVTLQGFVGTGCDNSTFTGECAPRDASVSLIYVADSSYLLTGLGKEAFRRAALASNELSLSDEDTVHTASGVLSVTGSTGALVPMLAVQLPLDLQTGMSDLREDNKFCARMDYDRGELIFVGLARIVTTVREYSAGYSIDSHTAVCWADMYADYVVVQISHNAVTPKRDLYVGPRGDELITPRLVDPGPLNDGTTATVGYLTGALCAGILLLMGIVCVGDICDRRGWQPLRRVSQLPNSSRPLANNDSSSWATGKRLVSWGGSLRSIGAGPFQRRQLVVSPSIQLDQMYSFERGKSCKTRKSSRAGGSRAWRGVPAMEMLGAQDEYHRMVTPTALDPRSVTTSWHAVDTPPSAPSTPSDDNAAHQYPYLNRRTTEPTCPLPCVFLSAAVESDDPEALADALEQCNDPNVTDGSMRTALHMAARAGNAHAVKVLVHRSSGGGPGAVALNLPDIRGQTPLHLAAEYGHLAVVRVLLSMTYSGVVIVMDMGEPSEGGDGSDLECSMASRVESMRSEGGCRNVAHVLVNKTDNNGCTPLHIAAYFGHDEVAGELLNAGAQTAMMMEDAFGNTPLHHAAMQGRIDTMLLLLRHSLRNNVAEDLVLQKNSRDQVRSNPDPLFRHPLKSSIAIHEQC
jgi:ankyrin repeat protein